MRQIWSVLVNWGNGFRNGAMLLVLFACSCLSLSAEEKDSVRVYTEEHPLIYEDAWDLWPYVFLNENGEAVGYNVDLLKMIFLYGLMEAKDIIMQRMDIFTLKQMEN